MQQQQTNLKDQGEKNLIGFYGCDCTSHMCLWEMQFGNVDCKAFWNATSKITYWILQRESAKQSGAQYVDGPNRWLPTALCQALMNPVWLKALTGNDKLKYAILKGEEWPY